MSQVSADSGGETVIRRLGNLGTDDEPRLCDMVNEVNSAELTYVMYSIVDRYVVELCELFDTGHRYDIVISDSDEYDPRPVFADFDNMRIVVSEHYLNFLGREFEYYCRRVSSLISMVSREFIIRYLSDLYYRPRNSYEDAVVSYVAAFSSSLRPLGASIGHLILEDLSNRRLRRSIIELIERVRRELDFFDIICSIEYLTCELVPLVFSEPLARLIILASPRREIEECLADYVRDRVGKIIVRPILETLDTIIHELNMYVIDRFGLVMQPLRVLSNVRSRLAKML
ncbi:MAG: hypothetical protein GXO23_04735 [Crenarchaeota archaeon]|nr:hypothetical protein [Thermoproteota archaeon]